MRRHARRASIAALTALLVPLALAGQESGEERSYRVGPKDLLEIRVFEEPSLNVDRRVSERGVVRLPLLGEFPVEGLTVDEIAAELKQQLEASYLQRASVIVEIREFKSKPISVIGAVKRPGSLELSGRWTLFQALTEAGGLSDNRGDVIYVLRRAENGLYDQLEISVNDLMIRGDQRVNIPIFADDVINVPPAQEVSVLLMGEVNQPGAVTFKSTDRITLLAVLARAGGLTERASNRVLIKRKGPDGRMREIVAHVKRILAGHENDPELRPGDLIVVKESFL